VHQTISGPAAAVTISGNSASRVFQIDPSVITTLNALTMTGGIASQGGAVINHGTLTLTYCVVNGNTALTEGGGVYVGGGGVLTVDHSTLSNNQTQNNGGGLFVATSGTASLTNCIVSGNSTQSTSSGYGGGGVYSRGTTSLANSTVSGNTAAKRGGGVYVSYGTTTLTNVTVSGNSANYGGGLEFYQGTVTLTNVTISGNSATGSGGGVWNQNSVNSTFKNTIVAGNTKTSGASDLEGRPISGTDNLIGTGGSGGLVNGVGNNQVGVANALLAPLANYGGPTPTMALLPGSLAIDAGTSTGAPSTDQRGSGRVGLTDIGAFESQGFTLATVAGSTPQSTIVTTPFTNPLAVAVTANNPAEPVNGGVINFSVPLIGASATLSSYSSSIITSQASVIATANGLAGSYDVTAATDGATSFNFSLTNIAQVVLSGLGNVVTYIQGGSPVAVAPTIVVTGNLGQNIASATIVFSNVQLGDRFSFDNQFALQHTYVEDIPNQTATLTLTGVDTPANYQTTLRSILVWNVASIPSTALRIATFTAFDVFANSGSGTQTIAVTLVSQPPRLFNIETTPINYVANYPSFPPQPISATLQVTDPDSDNLTSAIVQVTSGYQNDLNSHDLLTFTARFGISGLFDAVTGTLTLSGISSVSNYRAALQSITFSTSGPGTTGTTRTLSITAYDDTLPTPLASNTVTRNVSLTLSVAPPTLSGLGGTTTFVQLGNKVPIANSLVVTQPNGLNLASATVNLTNLKPGDRFEFSNSFALQHSFVLSGDQTSAVLTITGYTSAANYQTTLRSVTYWNVAGEPDYTPRTATFTIFDPTGQSDSGVQNFKVAPANQPPVLFGIESTPLVYSANHPEFPPQPISDTIAVIDPDSNTLTSATVQVTAGYQNDVDGHDLLSFVDRFGITSTFDPLTGTLTLAGSSSVSNYRVALRSILFSASGSAISGATRTLSIVAYDATIPIPLSSNTVTRDVNVITTNVSPVLSGLAGTANYLKGAPPLLIAPTLQVEDADSTVLFGATISFTNWQGGDRLDFWNQFALQHTFTEDLVTHTASLTLSGKSSLANYQIQLQSLGFYCLAGNPVLSARHLSIVVNDGYSNSNTVTGDITVST
jgi:parallel beta-helix repeat protein